jgi:hypothetical protein
MSYEKMWVLSTLQTRSGLEISPGTEAYRQFTGFGDLREVVERSC